MEELKMTNWRALREYRRIKRNRRRVDNIGSALLGIGFLGMAVISGDNSTLTLGQLWLWGLVSCAVMGLGCMLVNFIQALDEEYPVTLKLVDKGDRMCYTISTTKQKASV